MISKKDNFDQMLKVTSYKLAAASVVINNIGYVFFGGGSNGNTGTYNAVDLYTSTPTTTTTIIPLS